MIEDLPVNTKLVIPAAEIEELASRASGPGGQHVNTSATRVTLRWPVARSAALSDGQRRRLLERLGAKLTRDGALVVHADRARSRARNRDAARARLAELVAEALRVPTRRRPTRPTRASKTRQRASKQHRGEVKRRRRAPGPGDSDH